MRDIGPGFTTKICASFTTDEVRRSHGGGQGLASMPIGMLMYSTEAGEVIKSLPSPTYSEVAARDHFAKQFSYWLDSAGSREALRAVVDPLVFDLVDSLPEVEVSSASSVQWGNKKSGESILGPGRRCLMFVTFLDTWWGGSNSSSQRSGCRQ